MGFAYEPVTLAGGFDDNDAMLAYRDGRLIAVLARLGPLHAQLAGQWFVESLYIDLAPDARRTFPTLAEFEAWIA